MREEQKCVKKEKEQKSTAQKNVSPYLGHNFVAMLKFFRNEKPPCSTAKRQRSHRRGYKFVKFLLTRLARRVQPRRVVYDEKHEGTVQC